MERPPVRPAAESPAAELERVLAHPGLRGRWPGGFTGDDVLAELMALGRIRLDVHDRVDRGVTRFVCRVELRGDEHGSVRGHGQTLTAAALKCLIEAESDVAAEVARGLGALERLLDGS